MQKYSDAIVIGGGHAGVEAGLALSRLGLETTLVSISLNAIGFLACNPNIGGTAKGHLVREIDALGGEMGIIADKATIQTRMLNLGNGAAVHSLRNQVDKDLYHRTAKLTLERAKNLTILEGEVVELITSDNIITGIKTAMGDVYNTKVVVLCTGVYLEGKVIVGEYNKKSGPSGYAASNGLSKSISDLGISIRRFKTGTPPRVLFRSLDTSVMESQYGDKGIPKFSFMTDSDIKNTHPCYLTYTNTNTHTIILNNLERAPLYNGSISGTGPRYCPSVEDKIVRFKGRERHQIFIEPEGADTDEMYVQGLSTSMPYDIQEQMVHSISGLENAIITRYGYAIEYDCIDPHELLPTLATKKIKGLYCAGQINGSSGYEEAGAQGLIAGINAARYIQGKEPVIIRRDQAYIGVLIDDLVTKGTLEPYRMMTSRAEHRLHLRQDNADIRLTELGKQIGLVTEERYERYLAFLAEIEVIKADLSRVYTSKMVESVFTSKEESTPATHISARDILRRSRLDAQDLVQIDSHFNQFSINALNYVAIMEQYHGYLVKQESVIAEMQKLETKRIPEDFDYSTALSLRLEARQKLSKIKPLTMAQASRISGVNPADIVVLMHILNK